MTHGHSSVILKINQSLNIHAGVIFQITLFFTSTLNLQFQGHGAVPPESACKSLKLSDAVDFQTGSGPFSLRLAPNVMYGYVEVYLKTSSPGFKGQQSFILKTGK